MLNPANLLSILRIVLAPWVAWLLAHREFEAAIPWLVAAGASDWLDGFVARRFGWDTPLGAFLDPIADKAFAGAGFLALGYAGVVPGWYIGLVVGRDLGILAFSSFALRKIGVRRLPPTIWGKASTLFQFLYAIHRIHEESAGVLNPLLGSGLLAATTLMTAWSGIHYVGVALRLLRKGR